MISEKNNMLELLRKKAEDLIADQNNHQDTAGSLSVKQIFQEVQVYQLELEMQNDELQQTAIELEQQKNKFTNLFELAPIGYIVTDKAGIIKNINRTGLQLLGFDKNVILNKPLLLHVFKEDRDIFYKYFNQLSRVEGTQSADFKLVNSLKQTITVQIEGVALQTNSIDSVYLTVTDITAKQRAEQELFEAKQRLANALDASLTGIWEMDILNGNLYLDRFCCSLFGFEPSLHQQKYETLINCIHPNDRVNFEENIRKTIAQQTEFNVKFRTVFTDGNLRYIQARAQIGEYLQNTARLVGTFTDISEKTTLEIQASRIKEEQQQMILAAGLQAEENERKRISEVLHNGIAQMLYAIKLNVDQIKSSADTTLISRVNELLKQSITDVRNISFELAPAILTDFGLAATLEDMAIRLTNTELSIQTEVVNLSKTLDFQLQLNIFRIIQELVNNSIKHAAANRISAKVNQKNKIILIIVADNGIGFKTANEDKKPAGIGLSSIKNRLQLYKGTMKIDAKPEAGTSVSILLRKI